MKCQHIEMNSTSPESFRAQLGHQLLLFSLIISSALAETGRTNELARQDRGFVYRNDVIPEVPWSVHVFKLDRSHHEFSFHTTLGGGDVLGMANVSEQLKQMPSGKGQLLAAINGDYYEKSPKYQGRPRDLQVREGEVVSSPAGHTCFWMDPQGKPNMTNVHSRFTVTWDDGSSTPFGLNQERERDAAVLYTPAVGRSTRTAGGVELLLDPTPGSDWLPLRLARNYSARIKEVRNAGDSVVTLTNMVLSLGPKFAIPSASARPGALVRISTDSVPDLRDVKTAIGGGPALVQNRRVLQWPGTIQVRHPRTALGWNEDFIFLVTVDGRERYLSVGMTFPELADYMRKIGCDEALNLDGGGSSTFWAMGNVMNNPSEGRERPAPNALVILTQPTP